MIEWMNDEAHEREPEVQGTRERKKRTDEAEEVVVRERAPGCCPAAAMDGGQCRRAQEQPLWRRAKERQHGV